MSRFGFYQPIEVRYGDLDPQGHVNNASYLTYIDQDKLSSSRQSGGRLSPILKAWKRTKQNLWEVSKCCQKSTPNTCSIFSLPY